MAEFIGGKGGTEGLLIVLLAPIIILISSHLTVSQIGTKRS
jgi:hypothetical protein